ncbi:ATP-dependent DNA helicase RecG [Geodia barretti]|uniref:ATP-dependent DNA helicase RecG n=1 Tax=Geodia barretti TaxID=519541 RepID=A0AA35WC44_GEOBA|nr:ATP-dependent DNA helicase RecG [Geodia barretti]
MFPMRCRSGSTSPSTGKWRPNGFPLSVPHPEFEVLDAGTERQPEVRPVYGKPGDVSQAHLRGWVAQALERFGGFLPSFLPSEVAERQGLMDLQQALEVIHRPDSTMEPDALEEARAPARRSLAFDEFFYFQLALALRQQQRLQTPGFRSPARADSLTGRMRQSLPYRLTGGQERVLQEIYRDMESPNPMRRLLQGDVGAVAAGTELLAEQHYERLATTRRVWACARRCSRGLFPRLPGRRLTERIGDGEVDFVIGTHALIQEGVSVPRMGLGRS